MWKNFVVLSLCCGLILLSGCGVTAKDGSDGSDGGNGANGRDARTPIYRPWSYTGGETGASFDDMGTSAIKIFYFTWTAPTSNQVVIRVPAGAGHAGKEITAIINGTTSSWTVNDNLEHNFVFDTNAGIDTPDIINYLDCAPISREDKDSYIGFSVNGIQQEFYFTNSFYK